MTKYYIRNKHAGFLGNAPTWWAKGGRGYTAYVNGAEQFTEAEAIKMVKEDPDKYQMLPCDEINKRLHAVFDWQDLKRLNTEEGCGWSFGYARVDV